MDSEYSRTIDRISDLELLAILANFDDGATEVKSRLDSKSDSRRNRALDKGKLQRRSDLQKVNTRRTHLERMGYYHWHVSQHHFIINGVEGSGANFHQYLWPTKSCDVSFQLSNPKAKSRPANRLSRNQAQGPSAAREPERMSRSMALLTCKIQHAFDRRLESNSAIFLPFSTQLRSMFSKRG